MSGRSGALKPDKRAWLELQSQLMQRRRDWGPRRAIYTISIIYENGHPRKNALGYVVPEKRRASVQSVSSRPPPG